ncbi:MAG: FUSC family protein [Desulfitobacteriaceae bacterium]
MFIGARILKTGLAVTVALLLCKFFNIEPAIFAAITVVINMQPSVNKALRNAWEQVSVHVLGVLLAILLGTLLGNSPLVIGLAVILVIVLCNRLGWSGGISLGVVSIIFVLDAPPEQFLWHAGIRSLAVFIGLGVALVVNRILAPPQHKTRLKKKLEELYQESSAYFLESLIKFISSASFMSYEPQPPVVLQKKQEEAMWLYEHAREELTAKDNASLLERLLEISRGFLERGQNIDEMTAQRVKRRLAPDSPLLPEEVSSEFQRILDLLMSGEAKLDFLVKKVLVGLKEAHLAMPVEDDTDYWTLFDQAIDNWQRKVSGVFYLRAMMEIAVVATEMRWAGRRLKAIFQISGQPGKNLARETKEPRK